MMNSRLPLFLCFMTILLLGYGSAVLAAQIDVAAGESVQAAINKAEPGDVVRLGKGLHKGAVVIGQPVDLVGEPGAVIDGQGTGNVILVNAPNVVVRGLEVRGSGSNMPELNSGIFVARTGNGCACTK